MVAKLSLLDNIQLEAVESRITSIWTRLDQLFASSQYSDKDAEKEKKVRATFLKIASAFYVAKFFLTCLFDFIAMIR